jgi:hypothetical protein
MSISNEEMDSLLIIVGKRLMEVKSFLPKNYRIRIVKEDGKGFARTCDYDPYRINVTVHHGVIYGIESLG